MRNENRPKGWNEKKTNDSWAIFKIMGEFVSGFERMSRRNYGGWEQRRSPSWGYFSRFEY